MRAALPMPARAPRLPDGEPKLGSCGATIPDNLSLERRRDAVDSSCALRWRLLSASPPAPLQVESSRYKTAHKHLLGCTEAIIRRPKGIP